MHSVHIVVFFLFFHFGGSDGRQYALGRSFGFADRVFCSVERMHIYPSMRGSTSCSYLRTWTGGLCPQKVVVLDCGLGVRTRPLRPLRSGLVCIPSVQTRRSLPNHYMYRTCTCSCYC